MRALPFDAVLVMGPTYADCLRAMNAAVRQGMEFDVPRSSRRLLVWIRSRWKRSSVWSARVHESGGEHGYEKIHAERRQDGTSSQGASAGIV